MSALTTKADTLALPRRRAQVLADAVISAYIHELAGPVRPHVQSRRPLAADTSPAPSGRLIGTRGRQEAGRLDRPRCNPARRRRARVAAAV